MIAKRHTIWIWMIVLANAAFSAAMYSRLPDPTPTHWNIHGQVDGWGPRWLAASLFPAILAGVMLLLVLLPKLGPFRENLESIAVTYGRIVISVGLLMLSLNAIFILAAAGYSLPIGSSIALAISAAEPMARGTLRAMVRGMRSAPGPARSPSVASGGRWRRLSSPPIADSARA